MEGVDEVPQVVVEARLGHHALYGVAQYHQYHEPSLQGVGPYQTILLHCHLTFFLPFYFFTFKSPHIIRNTFTFFCTISIAQLAAVPNVQIRRSCARGQTGSLLARM